MILLPSARRMYVALGTAFPVNCQKKGLAALLMCVCIYQDMYYVYILRSIYIPGKHYILYTRFPFGMRVK